MTKFKYKIIEGEKLYFWLIIGVTKAKAYPQPPIVHNFFLSWKVYIVKKKDMLVIFHMPPSAAMYCIGDCLTSVTMKGYFLANLTTVDCIEDNHDHWPRISHNGK